MADANMVPDYYGALTAWRKMSFFSGFHILRSVNNPTPWNSGEPGEAVCAVIPSGFFHTNTQTTTPLGNHDAPHEKCHCGYYSFKDQKDAFYHDQGEAVARVEIWGRVVIHKYGYRSQYIKLKALHVTPSLYRQLDINRIVNRYHVDIVKETTWETLERQREQSLLNQFYSQNPLQSQYPSLLQPFSPTTSPSPRRLGVIIAISGDDDILLPATKQWYRCVACNRRFQGFKETPPTVCHFDKCRGQSFTEVQDPSEFFKRGNPYGWK